MTHHRCGRKDAVADARPGCGRPSTDWTRTETVTTPLRPAITRSPGSIRAGRWARAAARSSAPTACARAAARAAAMAPPPRRPPRGGDPGVGAARRALPQTGEQHDEQRQDRDELNRRL